MLLAGMETVDITPPAGLVHGSWLLRKGLALGTRDPLLAQALVFDDGERRIAIVAVDLPMIERRLVQAVRERVAELTGIPPEGVLVNASHNHTGPNKISDYPGVVDPRPRGATPVDAYLAMLRDDLAGAVFAANAKLAPARVGAGTGRAAGVSVNRTRPGEPIDDSVGVLLVQHQDGRPLAVLVRFSCHTLTLAGETLLWSADYPGPLRTAVEDAIPGATCMFVQGCGGDIAPWDFWFGNMSPRPHSFETCDDLGQRLGQVAAEVAASINTTPDARVGAASRTLRLNRRRLQWPLEEIEATTHRLLDAAPSGEDLPDTWPEGVHTTNSAQLNPLVYQVNQALTFCEIKRHENAPLEAEIQAFNVGDIAFVTNTFELFNQVGVQLAEGSPFRDTFVLGYSNGFDGYLPGTPQYDFLPDDISLEEILDQDAHRKHYGVTNTMIARGETDVLVAESLSLLHLLREDA